MEHDGEYDAHVHVARMVPLLGDQPEKLVNKERFFRECDSGCRSRTDTARNARP